MKKITISFFF